MKIFICDNCKKRIKREEGLGSYRISATEPVHYEYCIYCWPEVEDEINRRNKRHWEKFIREVEHNKLW